MFVFLTHSTDDNTQLTSELKALVPEKEVTVVIDHNNSE